MIYKVGVNGASNQLGSWDVNKGLDMKYEASAAVDSRRFFRIGTAKVKTS